MALPDIPLPKNFTKGAQAGINTPFPTSAIPAQTFSFSSPFIPSWGWNLGCLGGSETKLLILLGTAWAGLTGGRVADWGTRELGAFFLLLLLFADVGKERNSSHPALGNTRAREMSAGPWDVPPKGFVSHPRGSE